MKTVMHLVAAAAFAVGGLVVAGCQSNPAPSDQPPSSVGNGQTRNNGPFAPSANPPATNPGQ